MSDGPRFARPARSMGEKCQCEVKALVPESLRDEVAALAVLNRMTVSEYVRRLLETHCRGHLAAAQRAINPRGCEDQE